MKEKYTIYLVTGLIAYLSPILTSLLFVGGLVMFDWITGVIKAHKLGEISSRKMINYIENPEQLNARRKAR